MGSRGAMLTTEQRAKPDEGRLSGKRGARSEDTRRADRAKDTARFFVPILPQWLQCCIDYSAVWRSRTQAEIIASMTGTFSDNRPIFPIPVTKSIF